MKEAAALLSVHRSTLYRALERSEEVTPAEAQRRGAFREDALTEADAQATDGDQGERQEEGPTFLNDDGPSADLPTFISKTNARELYRLREGESVAEAIARHQSERSGARDPS